MRTEASIPLRISPGMVHISEVAPTFVREIRDHLKEGDEVRVKVINIDAQGRINLSIKQLAPPPAPAPRQRQTARPAASSPRPDRFEWSPRRTEGLTFEDMMSRFKQDSDEKISTLKKNADGKRGGGSYRKSGRY